MESTFDICISINGDVLGHFGTCKLGITVGKIVKLVKSNVVEAYLEIGGQKENKYVVDLNNMGQTIEKVIEEKGFNVDTFASNTITCYITE
ncbi:hypothetical protein H4S03_008773, partial [Coemansia sp. S3946]